MENEMEVGNLDQVNNKYPQRKDWVVGNFIKESQLRKTDNCEVKWSRFPKGMTKSSPASDNKTFTILISGRWLMKFENGKEIILENPGDYVIYENQSHDVESLAESHLINFRWEER